MKTPIEFLFEIYPLKITMMQINDLLVENSLVYITGSYGPGSLQTTSPFTTYF